MKTFSPKLCGAIRLRILLWHFFFSQNCTVLIIAELYARASGAPYLGTFGNLSIRENLVITGPYDRLSIQTLGEVVGKGWGCG